MKKYMLFSFLVMLLSTSLAHTVNGFRQLRPDEITYLSHLHHVLYNALPHSYKDWVITNEEQKDFDIKKYWCGSGAVTTDCIGTCPETLGKNDPYALNVVCEFSIPSRQYDSLAAASMQGITDFTNAYQVAQSLKVMARSKVRIQIFANANTEFLLKNCSKDRPLKIDLPISAALALKGINSTSCPVYEPGTKTPDLHAGDNYYDNALIILEKPLVGSRNEDVSDGQLRTWYMPGFDDKSTGRLITQNIVVEIKGDSDDIDTVIKMIDWKSLNELIAG